LICPAGHTLATLPHGATVATGALRRRVQLLQQRPDLRLVDIRGNLDTRLRKVVEQPDLDATMLAAAGLSRMGWLDRATELLDPELFVPAGGQGAIGVQVRAGDERARALTAALDHPETATRVTAERAFLARLEAGCQVPVAVHARLAGTTLIVDGILAGLDGKPYLRHRAVGDAADPTAVGRAAADLVLADGGRELREALRADGIE
jgi:hydroxymethylbilane synthase